MRLQGYVRVNNSSGEDYENAETRLIVGKINLLDQIAALARRQQPYGRPGPRPVPMPALGGAFGTESPDLDSWRSAAEVATDPFLVGMAGAEIVTGIGLRDTYTLLYPEAIILDDDIYHRARYALLDLEISPETLAVDVINAVQPGGHFLSQKHTRKHMRTSMVRSVIHQLDGVGKYRDPVEYAREKVKWILDNHHPEPPSENVQKEINRILKNADQILSE